MHTCIIEKYLPYRSIGTDSQSTSASQDPLASALYWKDEKDLDSGLKDPRIYLFKPERTPGLQLGNLTR